MSRTVSATISTGAAQDVTRPIYLVRMGWDTEVRACTFGADIVWNSETWTASGLEVTGIDSEGGALEMPVGDADPWLDLVTDEEPLNRTILVYEHQTDYTVSPAVSDAVLIFSGFMDKTVIGKSIRMDLIENKLIKTFPPTEINRPVYNYLLTPGEQIIWVYELITVN